MQRNAKKIQTTHPFFGRRILAVLFLGFSSGLPLALVGSTLQAWFTDAGVDVVTIGILTLIGVPYTWKFLWAPFMDRFLLPFLDHRRGWIFSMQFLLMLALALLAMMHPGQQSGIIGVIAFVIAFLSASQDIAVDAYRTDVLPPNERGLGASMAIFGYRMAMLVSGGVALIFADHLGWRSTYLLMAALMGVHLIVTFLAPHADAERVPPRSLKEAVVEPFKEFLSRPAALIMLAFIIFYKIGDAMALSLFTNFLLHGLNFTLSEVGFIYKTLSIAGTLLGAFLAGVMMLRLSLFSALLITGIFQAISNLMFVILSIVGKNYIWMASSVFVETFCSGMSSAAFVAFLMMLCHHRYTATQYALFSALTAIGRVFIGPIAGVMVASIGWTQFFAWTVLISLPGLGLLCLLRHKISFKLS